MIGSMSDSLPLTNTMLSWKNYHNSLYNNQNDKKISTDYLVIKWFYLILCMEIRVYIETIICIIVFFNIMHNMYIQNYHC